METITFSIISIFIAFTIFSVMKNIFFNKNQFTRKIRLPYVLVSIIYLFFITLAYFATYYAEDTHNYIQIIITFLGSSFIMIFTSIRIDENDTSARNKWKLVMQKDPKKCSFESHDKESIDMKIFYVITIIMNIVSALWFAAEWCLIDTTFYRLMWAYVIFGIIFTGSLILLHACRLGKLIRMNLLYNYIFELFKGDEIENLEIIDTFKKLFEDLFGGWIYRKSKTINKEILKYIDDCRKLNDGNKKK